MNTVEKMERNRPFPPPSLLFPFWNLQSKLKNISFQSSPRHCRFREFSCQRQDFPIKEGPAAAALNAARRRRRTCERELQLHVSNYSAALEERKSGQAPL